MAEHLRSVPVQVGAVGIGQVGLRPRRGKRVEPTTEVRGGFCGVAGQQQRGRVVLRLTPVAISHLHHRRLGGNQTWDNLPGGGARVAFNTSGMDAIRHWLLQSGAEVQVEAPSALVAWFLTETERMAALYRGGGGARA